MIKKIIALWIFLTWLISFSNATLTTVSLTKYPSSVNNQYDIWFLKWWAVLSQYLSTSKSIAAFDVDRLLRRDNNWFPYIYLKSRNRAYDVQWQYDRFYSCDLITWDAIPNNCSETLLDYSWSQTINRNILQWFFKQVNNDDLVYYNYFNDQYIWATRDYNNNWLDICRNSESIWKSVCFRWWYCYNNYSPCQWNIINSKNYQNLTFWWVPISEIGYAPWQNWYDGNYESDTSTSITINTQCPTIWQLMANMWSNYNTWLCYNNTTYFNWTTFETIDKQDIFTIFNDNYENYTNRISIYRNNCNAPATATACQTAFSGEYKKYSIIANAINSKVDEKKLRNYCNMWLNYDINATNCTAGTGIIKEDYTPEERLESIIGTINTIPTPNINITVTWWNNNVFNSLCDPNNQENCYTSDNIRDIFWSLQNIYWKITWLFRERNGVEGIIPEYILRITFVTILFTIIFKK